MSRLARILLALVVVGPTLGSGAGCAQPELDERPGRRGRPVDTGGGSVDTAVDDTAPPPTEWSELTGQVPIADVGRMPYFHCTSDAGEWRDTDDLYDGKRTVLHFNQVSLDDVDLDDLAIPPFHDILDDLELRWAKVVVVSLSDTDDLAAFATTHALDFELWHDEGILTAWYLHQDLLGPVVGDDIGPPMTLLLDEAGTVQLVYSADEVRKDGGAFTRQQHAGEVLADVVQLWDTN
jgi:peroxiredoxin